jgi:hypothetical protein
MFPEMRKRIELFEIIDVAKGPNHISFQFDLAISANRTKPRVRFRVGSDVRDQPKIGSAV